VTIPLQIRARIQHSVYIVMKMVPSSLNRLTIDYYYQITGQLALTGAQFCNLIVWTNLEIHVERIFPDNELWTETVGKLAHFYYTTLGVEILDRLCNI